jgi:hypothetical protein
MSLLKKLVLITLVALLLLASMLLYMQTRHGFRHVVIPLVAKLTGARVEVRDGLLSLLGALEVNGLVYEDAATGILLDADRLALRATPWSFIEDGVPRIDELELKRANLHMVHRPGPAVEAVREPEAETGGTFLLLPVAVERARFDDVTITVDEGNRRITGHVAAALNHLGPGRAGTLALQTSFFLERGDGTSDLTGTINLALSVDVGSEGTPIKWNGSNRVLARTGRGALESTDPEVLTFEQTLTGEYEHAAQNLRVASNVAIRSAGVELGTAKLTAAMEGAKRPAVTDASLTITGVTGDTLNLLLGKTTAAHVHAGRFDAQVEVHVEGTRTSIRGEATGSGVRVRSGDREVSPPIDLALHHVGSFDSATSDVSLEMLTLTVGDRAKTLLSGALDHPVSLHLDRPERAVSSAGSDTEPAIMSLRLTPSEIRELRPWLALLGSDPLKDVSAGRLGGALVVSMYEQGKLVDVAGRLEGTDVMLRGQGNGRTGFMGPLGIVVDWKSRLTDLQLLKLDPLRISVKLKDKQVATLHATGAGRFADATELTALNGTLELTALPGETLNPLLALWSQTRIGRAQIDGHADVTVDEGHARWQVDIRGQGLHLQLSDTSSDAPPLDLQINQRGEFDRKVQTLRLDQLNVEVVERRRPVVRLSLDQPLTLNLTQGKEESGSKTGGSSEPITLGVRVNSLGIHQLRPWIALAGSQALSSVRGGALDADLKVKLNGLEDVTVAGRLDLDQVTFERSKTHANAPVTLGTEVRASISGRSHVNVDSWAVRALDGKKLLAQARLTGSADSVGATDLALDVAASDLSEFVDRLGLLTERQRGLISGGNLTGKVQLVTAGPQKPLSVKGALHSVNLNIRLDKTHQMTRSLRLQAEVEVDAARSLAEIQRLEFAVESGGAKAGTLTASGRWPLPAAGTTTPTGAVNLTVKEWDTAPFVDFFGFLPGRGPGPLPLTGEIKFIQEAGGETLAVQGKETIGPVSITANGGNPESTTVHLEHDVVRNGNEIRLTALALTAERTKGRTDRVAINGNIRTGVRPRLQLRGSVDALNADWYRSLTASPSDQAPNAKTSGEPQDAKDKGTGLVVPLNLDIDLTIGAVIYQTLEFGKGRLVAKGDGERMQAMLEPTGLAGGSVQGIVTIALKGEQPEFGWDARGDTLDLGVLTKAAFAEPEPRVTGRGKFTTSGKGRGQGEALRQSLDGTIVFDVADGQFVKSPVLEFLAEQTHIKEFSGLGFRTLHGELQLKDGWVHLNQVRADGPSVAVEAGGKVGLDGKFDARVQPKIGPSLSDHVKIPCLDKFTKTADGFIVLPVAVTVKGTAENPIYGAEVTAGSMFGRQAGNLVGTIAHFLTGCSDRDATQKSTEEAVGAIKEQADSLIKGLLGGKKK